ncbi:MAG: hypothetical protein L6R37_002847 [Teloschistes peruensis]|nr:MAG: hypothetical protein L6R37_002847 [Teloschistes peruensis]
MSSPYTVRWGIIATGLIADLFVKDLILDPSTRDVSDVKHEVRAVASSSSVDRAKKFIQDCKVPEGCAAYGSYEELVKDKSVDIIYIATPHSHHYQNTMLCLGAGKHVLCEKAFTTNAAQAKRLIETAKAKNLFLMEAVWTRFFPLSLHVRKFIEDGNLGAVHRVIADNSFGDNVEEKYGTSHRMINMDLAGGCLLDLGIYSLTWLFQTLYHALPPQSRQPPSKIASAITPYHATGADEMTSIILTFPSAPGSAPAGTHDGSATHPAHGIALTNLRVATDPDGHNTARPSIRIQGTKGEIQIDGPAFRPRSWRVIYAKAEGEKGKGEPMVEIHDCEIPGQGMFWEADECARCLRDGKIESEGMGWEESVVIMEVMDEVRRQGGIKYPETIESLDFPLKL